MKLQISSPKIWLSTQSVDFRKSIDGLCELIQSTFALDLKSGIFIFFNRGRKKVKILTWHGNGFVLIYKRMEQGCFTMGVSEEGLVTIDEKQLSWLMAGLDWYSMSRWNELEFDSCY